MRLCRERRCLHWLDEFRCVYENGHDGEHKWLSADASEWWSWHDNESTEVGIPL